MNKALAIILCTVTLDAIGIGLIAPILPELLREVSHTGDVALLYGLMIALYAAMQFLFSPVLGVLSDRFGRRPVLIVSLIGAAIDYVIMAIAPQLWMLVIGRAIAGLTSANMAVATAYITDISAEEQRAQRFGYFHAMWGIGFIIGPVLGGLLGEYWVRAPFLAAALFNAINCALAFFILPESRPGQRGARFELKALNPLIPFRWALGFRTLLPLMGIHLIMMFVGQMYGTVWVLFGEDQFGWTALWVGLSLAAFGVFHAGAQAFLVGPVAARVGERAALIIGFSAEVTCLLILSLATEGWVMFALMPLFAIGGLGMPALQALATTQVDADRQGQLQGVLASIVSVSSIFGPIFYGGVYALLKDHWTGGIWLVGALIYCIALPLMFNMPGRARAENGVRAAQSEP